MVWYGICGRLIWVKYDRQAQTSLPLSANSNEVSVQLSFLKIITVKKTSLMCNLYRNNYVKIAYYQISEVGEVNEDLLIPQGQPLTAALHLLITGKHCHEFQRGSPYRLS